MSIVDSVKRAPRWAWLTAAGVGLGAGAVKLYRDRDAEPGELVAGEVQGAPDAIGTAPSPIAGAPGIVVPPVIMGGGGSETPSGFPDFLGAIGDVFAGYTGLLQLVVGGNQALLGGAIDNLGSIAQAGGPPGQAVQNPTPVVVTVPVPQAAPAPLPAPAPAPAPAPKPCCLYNGRPLTYWQQNRGNNGKWGWPDGQGYSHSRPFEGNKACDGGGTAGGSKRDC